MQSCSGTCNGSSAAHPSGGDVADVGTYLKAISLFLLVAWTVFANGLVFVVLYKNPRLRTVPNLLVANLAFSDFMLGLAVMPFSTLYAINMQWSYGKLLCELWLSTDILVCTASIWNLSVIGLDRYWAITNPVTYMTKRTVVTAAKMIAAVWALSAAISVAPLLGWKSLSATGNYIVRNGSGVHDCVHYEDLPSFTIYSATGSFYIPLLVMFFVYFRIYQAFAEHKARQLYRQMVIKQHLESTILHDLSQIQLPEDDSGDADDSADSDGAGGDRSRVSPSPPSSAVRRVVAPPPPPVRSARSARLKGRAKLDRSSYRDAHESTPLRPSPSAGVDATSGTTSTRPRYAARTTDGAHGHKRSGGRKPAAISAAKEKRGVKVLGIILGCFTLCWLPFFIMYFILAFCETCSINPHVEQFITWLGYVNSGINPIIYTVFNRDYQNALKRLLQNGNRKRTVKL